MPATELTGSSAPAPTTGSAAFGQFRTAWRFALRNQTRNRLAALLLALFVPAWYLLLLAMTGHHKLNFRLYSTGQVPAVDGGRPVPDQCRAELADPHRRLCGVRRHSQNSGLRQAPGLRRLPSCHPDRRKNLAIAIVAAAVACYTAAVLLVFWRPTLAGWLSIPAGFTVIALTYGALGLLLGVLIKSDLEVFSSSSWAA